MQQLRAALLVHLPTAQQRKSQAGRRTGLMTNDLGCGACAALLHLDDDLDADLDEDDEDDDEDEEDKKPGDDEDDDEDEDEDDDEDDDEETWQVKGRLSLDFPFGTA